MKRYLLLLLVVTLNVSVSRADEPFVVSDIRVEGLQRISAASVFASLPVNVGDSISEVATRNAIRSLFRSGNFDDIRISRDSSVLVVTVVERPSISEINLEGNKAIETDALLDGLKNAGLSEGQVFKRSTLEGMKMELTRQYVSQGRYDASIDTDVVSLPRNRVGLNINIDEGTTAAIKHINIVGNSVYDDEELRDLFELKTTGFWSWISSNDKYAKEKLSGDLEKLTSYYLDSGYIKFSIDSTQVSVSPDRKSVYITVNINEGDKYQVGEVDLSGDIILAEEELRPFIFVHSGETFSQAQVTSTQEWLTKRLGNEGYNFAKVEGIPEINDDGKIVNLKFFIDPGKRTYVRRINFDGNVRTADEVLRREMRQMETAPASSAEIENSRIRLERLGYFKEAKVETKEVPGTDDLIDLQYSVEEQASGSIGASIGFSQDSGIILGANLQQDNFLGTGKQIGIGVNKSDYLTSLNFSYVNPYFTKDGVSRGFSVYYSERDLDKINVSRYSTNTFGANLNFGYPIKETERLGFSFGYSNTKIEAGAGAVQEIIASPRLEKVITSNGVTYFADYYQDQRVVQVVNGVNTELYLQPEVPIALYDSNGNVVNSSILTSPAIPGFLDTYGDSFDNFSVTTSWTQSTLNRGRLATRGASQSLSLELAVPGSDLEYFKLVYNGQIFFPITEKLTLRLRSELGYGDGFDGDELPFFNNFYAGGFGSVRGFRSNTLGPRSTPADRYLFRQATTQIVEAGQTYGTVSCGAGLSTGDFCSDGTTVVGSARAVDTALSYVTSTQSGSEKILYGPVESKGDPFGGNVLVEGGMELLFPLPFIKDQRSIRSAIFIDVGNVFSSYCSSTQVNCFDLDLSELRYSYGVGVSWITGFGPLTFSFARPINNTKDDKIEAFQFSLGRSF